MIRLIKAEFKKIFHKKSFYVVTFLFLLYALLTNFIYKDMDDYYYEDDINNIAELEQENRNLDLNNSEDLLLYIDNLNIIETEKLIKNYSDNNQKHLVEVYLAPIISELNENKYLTKDSDKETELENKKNNILTKIDANDWQYFVNTKVNDLKNKIANTNDKNLKERLEIYLKLAEYRLNNNVSFDYDNYLNNAIEAIEVDLVEYKNLSQKEKLAKQEKERFVDLDKSYLENQYILEHKVDLNNNETLRSVLQNFPNEFQLFILIYIVMICGSVVSEEFNKGTIKYLLTKPYKRRTILTSKLLTVLILIPLIILFMVLVEVLMGGVILGFDSLNIPILIYNASKGILESYSCVNYLFLILITSAPIYLTLIVLCFALSTITCSTSAAITITFLFYLVSEVVINLVKVFNIKFLKIFVSIHWDFTYLINYEENLFKFEPIISLLIVMTYLCVTLCLIYGYFSKKDVKNI